VCSRDEVARQAPLTWPEQKDHAARYIENAPYGADVKNIIKRTTLIVRDMEKSVHWYTEVLGMTKYYDNEVVLSGGGLPAGGKGDRTRLVILKAEDPVIGMIGLLQWIEPKLPGHDKPPTYQLTFGQPVFVVQTDDARGVSERAMALNTRIQTPLHDSDVTGADGRTIKMRSVYVFDPDGHFYEVNQRVAVLEAGMQ
jgi:catechol 2,3-dioxygenase-like lactoylglutathione lyase family enzyme